MIQLHMTKMDLTPVKTAAEAKFLAYLSPLSIGFRMLYHTTEFKNNSFFPKIGSHERRRHIYVTCQKNFPSNHNNEDR